MNKTFVLRSELLSITLILVSLIFNCNIAYSQWTNQTTYIYYSTGNVGIGLTTAPLEKLQLNGSVRGNINGALRVSTGYGYIDLGPQNNTGFAHIQTDRDKFYMSKPLYLADGKLSSYNTSNLFLQTNGTNRLTILNGNGNVGIGSTNPQNKLDVNGTIHAKEVKVDLTGWSDFVFEPAYKLRPLNEVETFINCNKHLPEMAPAMEMINNGANLGEMQIKLLQKIEELTLYIIQQDKIASEQGKAIEELRREITALRSK